MKGCGSLYSSEAKKVRDALINDLAGYNLISALTKRLVAFVLTIGGATVGRAAGG